jgi:hypothetical protein
LGRALRALQAVPRSAELSSPGTYLRSAGLHRRLKREGYTVTGGRYGRALYRLARDAEERAVPGAVVDCGVFNGGSTLLLAAGAPSRQVWAFDSFEGMPEPSDRDGAEPWGFVGTCRGSEQKVREGFERHSDPRRLHLVKGLFEDTLAGHAKEIGPIAVLHVDCDWYEPITHVLETLYDQVSPGGHVAVDDYKTWQGARRAVDEFRARREIASPLVASHHWRKD